MEGRLLSGQLTGRIHSSPLPRPAGRVFMLEISDLRESMDLHFARKWEA
jgi:hypothetical protein